jgi:site-specific recombinase XerD
MQWMWESEKKPTARVMTEMKTAVSTLFRLRFTSSPSLADNAVVQSMVKSFRRQKPVLKRRPQLNWKWAQMKDFLRTQQPPHLLTRQQLSDKAVTLVRAFTGLRSTEVRQLVREKTNPSADGRSWKFVILGKRRTDKEEIVVPGHSEIRLDPIAHLVELRKRVRQMRYAKTNKSFWVRRNGKEMGEGAIRKASARMMAAAGIKDKRSYHLKHATATELMDRRIEPEKIRSFLRHSQSSKALMKNYVDLHNNAECVEVLGE